MRVALLVAALFIILSIVLSHTHAQPPNRATPSPAVLDSYTTVLTWTEVITTLLSPTPLSVPLLAIDGQGQVHLLWDTDSSQVPQYIYHTYWLTASGWTTPTYVAYSLGTSRVLFPPVVGTDGTIYYLWVNKRTSSAEERLLYASFGEGIWSPEGEGEQVHLGDRPGLFYTPLQGMVHLDGSDGVHVTVVQSQIYHYTRTVEGWSDPVQIPNPSYSGWVWPDRYGGVHFYGNDYRNVLYYSYWHSGEFVVRNQTASGVVVGRQTQIDGLNNLHIFWTDLVAIPWGSVTGVYHQCLDSALEITPEEVLSGQRNVSHLAKAFGEEQSFVLSWQEAPSDTIKLDRTMVGLWRGCTRLLLETAPMSPEYTLKSAAVSDSPSQLCLLMHVDGSEYAVICAKIGYGADTSGFKVYLPHVVRGER